MFKTDSFLGNKTLSLNQNVWRNHATVQLRKCRGHYFINYYVMDLYVIGSLNVLIHNNLTEEINRNHLKYSGILLIFYQTK